jgi:hypothetical protein
MRAMAQERPVRVERRLSAISTDNVAGYSRLMHHDEEATRRIVQPSDKENWAASRI